MTDLDRIARERDLAEGEAKAAIRALDAKVTTMDEKLDKLSDQVSQWQGAQRVLLWASGGAAAIAGYLAHLLFPPPPGH